MVRIKISVFSQPLGTQQVENVVEIFKHRLRSPFFVVLEFWETLLKTVKKTLCEFIATTNESNTASEGLFVLLSGSEKVLLGVGKGENR